MSISRIDRTARSLLTLNRDREYTTLRRMLGLKATDTLLDSGCGDGFWTARFARQCAQVTGVDPGKKTLEHAKTLHALPNITYICGTGERLPFPDASFDKAVSISSLEHFGDPLQGLREMARVIKPGGRLALSVDSILPENSERSFHDWHKQRHFVTQYFTQNDLFEMMESVGLQCEANQTVHLFRSRFAARLRQTFIRRAHYWLPLFPAFYFLVRISDRMFNDMHGQIIIVTASRQAR